MATASALEQNASLEILDLRHCGMEDEGIEKLATSLRCNTTLQYMYVEGNHVSSNGFANLLRCAYDTASMRSLYESNHTLRAFYRHSPYSPRFPETPANRRLICRLGEVLMFNRRHSAKGRTVRLTPATKYGIIARVAACKILGHYLGEDQRLEYWECVEGMEQKLIPHVIGWLVRHADVHVIYGVVRDMPWMLEKNVGGKASNAENLERGEGSERWIGQELAANVESTEQKRVIAATT